MSGPLFLLGILVVILLFWFESLRMREYVVRRCNSVCQSAGLQLLDQTVALSSISPARDSGGRWRIRRCYQFHVSEDGANRHQGLILLTGRRVESVQIEGESGTTILHEERPMQIH